MRDPLHCARTLLRHLYYASARIVDPTAAAVYDENRRSIKAGTMTKQYISNRLAKYAIRLYGLCNPEYTYYFSIFDNGKGNIIHNSQSDCYTSKRWYFTNAIRNNKSIDSKLTSLNFRTAVITSLINNTQQKHYITSKIKKQRTNKPITEHETDHW